MQAFWTTEDLARRGWSARAIAQAARSGALLRIRTGWFAEPDARPELVRAVRLGGVATAHSAARALGLWTPPDDRLAPFRRRPSDAPPALHVAVPSNRSIRTLRDPDTGAAPFVPRQDVVLHWTDPRRLRMAGGSGHVDVLLMLEHLFLTEQPERALAVLDSALRLRHLRVRDLHALAAQLPAHLRPVVFAADGRAESGIETIVRERLRQLGVHIEVQQQIDGVGRVDLLVERLLIVECDGREWHDDDEAFERDRSRDLIATTGRYRILRLTWFRVLFRWAEVEAAVLAILAA